MRQIKLLYYHSDSYKPKPLTLLLSAIQMPLGGFGEKDSRAAPLAANSLNRKAPLAANGRAPNQIPIAGANSICESIGDKSIKSPRANSKKA